MKASPRLSRSFPVLTLTAACALAFAACSSSNTGGGTGGTTGSGTGGSNTGTGGSNTGTGGSNTGTGGSNTGTGGSNTGTGGTVATGGTTGTGGTNTGTGGTTATGGTSGSGGAGGSHTGGTTGTGGTNNGGHGGGTAGAGGSSTGGTTGGGGAGACPANATFCSGFETNALPTGAVYMVNAAPGDWSRDFAVDTTQKHSGSSSLLVKAQSASGSSGSAYRMLAVPGTPGAFWVRFWVQSATTMGAVEHNAFAGGSIGSSPNDMMIEFAEDVGIAFNTSDQDVWPTGYGRLSNGSTMPYTIPAMTWTCVEISYDGTNKHQQLFINGTQKIDATGYPGSALNLTYFKFGYEGYHTPLATGLWYDDVVVAPTRIGCN